MRSRRWRARTASPSPQSTARIISARPAHTPSASPSAASWRWCSANSPKAMAFWGGRKAMLGTNPLAFSAPLPGGAPTAGHRPRHVRRGTRQDRRRREGRQADPERLGRRRGRPAHLRPEGCARRHAAADRRRQGRSAGADDRDPGGRRHRQRLRLGSEFLLRRQGRPAEPGSRIHRARPRPALGRRVRVAHGDHHRRDRRGAGRAPARHAPPREPGPRRSRRRRQSRPRCTPRSARSSSAPPELPGDPHARDRHQRVHGRGRDPRLLRRTRRALRPEAR